MLCLTTLISELATEYVSVARKIHHIIIDRKSVSITIHSHLVIVDKEFVLMAVNAGCIIVDKLCFHRYKFWSHNYRNIFVFMAINVGFIFIG